MVNPDSVEKEKPSREELIQEARRKVDFFFDSSQTEKPNFREKSDDRQERIIKLGKELEVKGIDPEKYVYWHILIGSTKSDEFNNSAPLDTPNSDIEKLIDELIK